MKKVGGGLEGHIQRNNGYHQGKNYRLFLTLYTCVVFVLTKNIEYLHIRKNTQFIFKEKNGEKNFQAFPSISFIRKPPQAFPL